LVAPATADAQLRAEQAHVEVADGEAGSATDDATVTQQPRRFYGVVAVDPDRLGRDAGRLAQEVVAHLQGLVGTDTEVIIEIRATNADGFPETIVKIVSENAAALRFTDHGFEAT